MMMIDGYLSDDDDLSGLCVDTQRSLLAVDMRHRVLHPGVVSDVRVTGVYSSNHRPAKLVLGRPELVPRRVEPADDVYVYGMILSMKKKLVKFRKFFSRFSSPSFFFNFHCLKVVGLKYHNRTIFFLQLFPHVLNYSSFEGISVAYCMQVTVTHVSYRHSTPKTIIRLSTKLPVKISTKISWWHTLADYYTSLCGV